MTLDAMHWVWTQSRSKANARVALLYVADQVRTLACEVRVAQREFMDALNSNSKSTTEAAVKKAVELGELEIVEAATGRRPALYRLPKAVGYVRSTVGSSPETREKDSASSPETGEQSGDQGRRSSPKSGERENRSSPDFDRSSPKTGAPPHTHKEQAGRSAGEHDAQQQDDGYGIPEFARPLVDELTNAGVVVRWPFVGNEWFIVHALIKKSGVQAMVDHARKAASRANVESAKYFMQGWRELPPLPRSGPAGPAPAATKPPWCEDPYCDEITRTRDAERPDGLRVSVPCPHCHPAARKDPAA